MELAVNTAQSHAQIGLIKDGKWLHERRWEKAKSHSEVITQECSTLLQEGGYQWNQLRRIYCVIGPGSFTGLRVGINFVKTMAYSHNIPLVPINTLDLYSWGVSNEKTKIFAAVDAQKNSVFFSLYEPNLTPLLQNQVIEVEKLGDLITEPILICGDGLHVYKDFIATQVTKQFLNDFSDDPADLKNILNHTDVFKEQSWESLQPLYIKASAPEEKLNPTRFEKYRG